jgi:hypothetical protein
VNVHVACQAGLPQCMLRLYRGARAPGLQAATRALAPPSCAPLPLAYSPRSASATPPAAPPARRASAGPPAALPARTAASGGRHRAPQQRPTTSAGYCWHRRLISHPSSCSCHEGRGLAIGKLLCEAGVVGLAGECAWVAASGLTLSVRTPWWWSTPSCANPMGSNITATAHRQPPPTCCPFARGCAGPPRRAAEWGRPSAASLSPAS